LSIPSQKLNSHLKLHSKLTSHKPTQNNTIEMSLDNEKASFKQRMLNQPVIRKKNLVIKEDPIFYSNTGKSVNRLLFEVVSTLKQQTEPITNQDMIRKTTIDIESNPDLLEAVRVNERITITQKMVEGVVVAMYQYQATYHIRTKVTSINTARSVATAREERGCDCNGRQRAQRLFRGCRGVD
jgi:TFIIE beta subunit core domain